jgi:methionyl aminopeptidase
MTAESENDILYLKAVGRLCAEVLRKMIKQTRPGVTTAELDEIGRELLAAGGAHSAPQVTYNFPAATCISVSPVIAHGIPGTYTLKDGDLIHIDVSAELDGYYADTGASLLVGNDAPVAARLLEATKSALWKALRAAQAGRPLNEIGRAVQAEATKRGYRTIIDLTGHGIGRKLHEAPADITNFYNPRDRRIMNDGLVLAVEPFLTTGKGRIVEERDGWSLRTADRSLAAQFEHTIVVTRGEPIILTNVTQ